MNVKRTSCIIPFWNEGLFLFNVLDEVSKAGNIDEIICVDDASENDNYIEIQRRYAHIKLIRLPENVGKTDAIREGLKIATGNYILLLDADLQNLNRRDLERAIRAVYRNPSIDMLILRRVNADLLIRMYRADVLFTGERILKKSDLLEILHGPAKRWQLESAINTWMYLSKKKVYWIPQSATNTDKSLKWGLVQGLINDVRTFADMMFATGLNNFFRQIFFYAKDELKLT
ncbi:MAG TPA: glycosyltransferase family 2 protein [Bacteroidales bacterium]|jgi:glycosyltransferase involved in cell wall biosynthesis|nr:glycosyltransferase family 2 protein [Bacteroidales bacterium]